MERLVIFIKNGGEECLMTRNEILHYLTDNPMVKLHHNLIRSEDEIEATKRANLYFPYDPQPIC